MSGDLGAIVIECDDGEAASLADSLRNDGMTAQASSRKNLDGSTALQWIVVAVVAADSATTLVNRVIDAISRHRVQRIEYNGLVIVNPRPNDVDTVMDALRQQIDQAKIDQAKSE